MSKQHPSPKTNRHRDDAAKGETIHGSGRPDDGDAFFPDPGEQTMAHAPDNLAETLAEEFIASATSAEEVGEEVRDEVTLEEVGGPFVEAKARDEFAEGVDEANPEDAEREAFPTAMRSLDEEE